MNNLALINTIVGLLLTGITAADLRARLERLRNQMQAEGRTDLSAQELGQLQSEMLAVQERINKK